MAAKTKSRGTRKKCAPKRKTKASSAPKSVITVGGKRYKKVSCHPTAAAAKSAAKKKRTNGYNARVKGKCVFARKAK